MSQRTLAGLAGLSQSYVSQIEAGQRPLDRKSTQVAIAAALNISVAQLLGRPDEIADPARDRAVAYVPTIRSTLIELSAQQRRTPTRDAETLRAAVRKISEQRNAADYAGITSTLSELLLDLAGHGPGMSAQLIEALFAGQFALHTMGYLDLARQAAELGIRAAAELDAPQWHGAATFSWVQAFPPESAVLGAQLAVRAADMLQGAAGRAAQETYGRLHLLVALHAAVGMRGDEAAAHLNEAADVARHLGEPTPYGHLSAGMTASWFGPTQVNYWRISVAAELGDATTALDTARNTDLAAVPIPNRHVYYWTDLARVLAATGDDQKAMHALARAERVAPQHFRFNPVARNLVGALVERARRRAVAADFAALARNLGIHPV